MSNFGAKLAEILERKRMRASELSRLTGINDGLISKWINGQQKFVSNADLANLCGSISTSPREQAELVRAHLLDEIGGPGSELIEIKIRGAVSYSDPDAVQERPALPLKLQRAFDRLMRESITDADVRNVILSLDSLLNSDQTARDDEAVSKVQETFANPSKPGKRK